MKKANVFLAVLVMVMAVAGILFGAPRLVVVFDVVVFVGAFVYVFWQLSPRTR